MKVFVAGASGALGRQLVPRLVAAGYEVTGAMRRRPGVALMAEFGARAVVMDALDPDQVARAVADAEPEVIVHQLTAISSVDVRNFDRSFALTNRLRTEGTDNLLAAGQAVGVQRFVAQSYAGWPYARTGTAVKAEQDPLDDEPPKRMRQTLAAIKHLERAVLDAHWTDGIVLRYGGFYGPGTSLSPGGEQAEAIRTRKFPVVGDGGGIWSFVHVADAADATVAAVTRGRPGIYNIVDDEPARVADWLPELARQLGAPAPRRLPTWLARIAAGEAAVRVLTEIRGASNQKAKREFGWQPAHVWRDGMST
jgi:nucleoside-diphosphate-sugar epimerase